MIFFSPNHILWVLFQQFAVRGMIAFKFFLAARLLGPDQIGFVGIATLSVVIVESLSDTGLSQAIVQSHTRINRQKAGAVWTLQFARGLVLAGILFIFSTPFSELLRAPNTTSLILIASIMPLLRNAINPGIFLVLRERNFRKLSLYEASAALFDLVITVILIHYGIGPASILLGSIASDGLKLFLTWTWYSIPLIPNFKWRSIKQLTSYGKWVWGASVITLILNQMDKILVARFLGVTELGLYQVASRIAHLFIADGAVVLGQYLYPTFAQQNRISRGKSIEYLYKILRRWLPMAATLAILLVLFSKFLVISALGIEWAEAVPLLRALTAPMFLGAIISLLVAYLRGIGSPRRVTEGTMIQLVALLIFAPILLNYYSAIGMALALALAGIASVVFMSYMIMKSR